MLYYPVSLKIRLLTHDQVHNDGNDDDGADDDGDDDDGTDDDGADDDGNNGNDDGTDDDGNDDDGNHGADTTVSFGNSCITHSCILFRSNSVSLASHF